MTYSELLSILAIPINHFVYHGYRTYWLYLATSLVIALLVQMRNANAAGHDSRSPLKQIFPREVYTHPSSIVDYVYFVINALLYAVILTPFAGLPVYVSTTGIQALRLLTEPQELLSLSPLVATVLFSLVIGLVADFGTYFAHWLMHRVPVLWEFHKVHHSAEVLTPLTVYRIHPLDDMLTLCVVSVLVGGVDALVRFFLTPSPSQYLLLGLGVLTLAFYVFGYNLRHSHVWVSYGQWMSRILISPAQHQIHHSKAKQHWDKNFGFIFALWDWAFGSLYVPRSYEKLEFGIGGGEEREFSSVVRLYCLPFLKAWRKVLCSFRRSKR